MSPRWSLLLLLAAGCASGGASAGATASSEGAAASANGAAGAGARVVATLVGTGGSRTAGTLTLTAGTSANSVRARLELINAPGSEQLTWIIRQGQCGEPGPEVGPMAAYRRIQTRGDGSAEVSATLPIPMPRGNAYHARVMSTSGSTIACGGLSEG